jgi:sugar transferase (PEP-CTERM/EpsH1 system associated)
VRSTFSQPAAVSLRSILGASADERPIQPLRIMHVLYALDTGGAEKVTCRLIRALGAPQFEHIICILDGKDAMDPGVRVIEVEQRCRRVLFPHFLSLFRRERPDIVHSRNWGAIEAVLAARAAGVPLVVHSEHGRNLDTIAGEPWRRRLIRRICFRAATRLVCVSEELKEHYCRLVGAAAKRFEVIRNGVDTDLYRPDPAARASIRRQLGIGNSTIVLGTVGRLDPVKNQQALLRAAEGVIQEGLNIRVVLIGDGVCRGALDDFEVASSWLLGRVSFLGDRNDVPSLLNAFDIFVLPSLSEGLSNTLLEAMATALPVVASAVGGNPEVIEDGVSGLLFPAGEAEALARILVRLGRNAHERSALGAAARERAQRQFSFGATVEKYEHLYGPARRYRPTSPV